MIQSGLYTALIGAPSIQFLLPLPTKNFVHFVRAPKEPGNRFIVLHLINVPPAASTLDGVSELIDGEFQLDHYAEKPLIARAMCKASRQLFENFSGTLSDGTTIEFYEVPFDFDGNYEVGGTGYLFRSVLRLRAFYSEAGASPPPPGPVNDMAQTFHLVSQAGDNASLIKASQGFVLGGFAFCAPTTLEPVYVKLFDQLTRPNPAGGDIPKLSWGVEPGLPSSPNIPRGGLNFANGIYMLIVKGMADNDDTSVAAGALSVDVYWQ